MPDEHQIEQSNVKSAHNDPFLEPIKQTIDIDNLHPEERKRLQMLGLIVINEDGEYQEASDKQIDDILQKSIQNEDPNVLADKYMMKHGLYDLLKAVTTKIVLNRPADPVGFMADDLEQHAKSQAN